MKNLSGLVLVFLTSLIFVCPVKAQISDICEEVGLNPSFDSPFAQIPYVYGKIILKGFDPAKTPNVSVTLLDALQNTQRWTISKSGNYCFRVKNQGVGTLIVELNGVEFARKSLTASAGAKQREDFEIISEQTSKTPPGVISAKFSHPENPKTVDLYKKITAAEQSKDSKKVIEHLKEIVAIDPADFLAWAKLGTLYFYQKAYPEAEASLRKSLELKVEYTPAWVYMGNMRIAQKQFEAAIQIFNHALELEPKSARIYQLLGETYLQTKQGSLGVESLNKAIELDPNGMAECHLQLAHLYQLAKANKMATKEYKLFLSKVPDYKDKKKLEEFIAKNPE